MRFALYGAASAALAGVVIANAFVQKQQFFTGCIYLTRSNASLMVLLNFGLFLAVVFGKALQRFFFGPLRALEVEHLYERSWFAVTETCLAMTIFRDEFDIRSMVFFAILLLVEVFHWIFQDRVDFMEQAPNPSVGWHVRMQAVATILLLVDVAMLTYVARYTYYRGASMMIMFAFEYAILVSLIVSASVKYALHSYDLRREHPWEEKSMYIFYVDLVHDFVKLVTYLLFFGMVVYYYSLPIHIMRDLYNTFVSFVRRCRDLVQYRRATANMNERYPNATAEDLAATDRICIICREEMELPADDAVRPEVPAAGRPGNHQPSSGDVPKKLHCGHIFHFRCLRSWLERQQTCPTCRRSVLERPPVPPNAPAPNPEFQAFLQQHNQRFGAGGAAPVPPVGGVGGVLGSAPPATGAQSPSTMPTTTAASSTHASPPQVTTAAEGGMLIVPLNALMPLVPLSPTGGNHALPALDHLTQEQVRRMDGTSREAVEERVRALQNVQIQLSGLITQLTQIAQMTPTNAPSETERSDRPTSSAGPSSDVKGKRPENSTSA